MEEEEKTEIIKKVSESFKVPTELLETPTTQTAEQIKSFYNSEQWKEVKERYEAFREILTPIIERVTIACSRMYDAVVKAYSIDPEIRKCYRIYKKTKKR